jgi:hypothetical protein
MKDRLLLVVPVSEMKGDDEDDSSFLRQMLDEAREYILSFKWCKTIQKEYFASGTGGIIALFIFDIENFASPRDSFLWVVVGDLPSAYFVIDDACNSKDALCVYIDLMKEWIEAVLSDSPIDDCFPVRLPPGVPTKEAAKMLKGRLEYLETEILPEFSSPVKKRRKK